MTYDIESLFKTSDNPKYRNEHIPFLICYDIIKYNKDTDEYEFQIIEQDNNLKHLKPGNYIISENPFEEFYEIILKAMTEYKI